MESDGNVEAGGSTHARIREATCVECGVVTDPEWSGWRAYRITDPELSEDAAVWFYCPRCALREFGEPGRP